MDDGKTYFTPPKAIEHANYIANKVAQRVERKYLKGDCEHRGDLSRKNTLPMLIEEAMDLSVYAIVLEDNIDEAVLRLKIAEDKLGGALKLMVKPGNDIYEWKAVQAGLNAVSQALNILTIGNPEGVPEEER